jgi:hypothetical protein
VLTFLAQLAGTALTVVGAFIDPYANIGRIVSGHPLTSLVIRLSHILNPLDDFAGPSRGAHSPSSLLQWFHSYFRGFHQTHVSDAVLLGKL